MIHHDNESTNFEYFVPRSVSEFNLAASVQDVAIPVLPIIPSALKSSTITTTIPPTTTITDTTLSQTTPTTNLSCINNLGQVRTNDTTVGIRNREKMVTFEDEGCHGSTPTRKNNISTMENIFM